METMLGYRISKGNKNKEYWEIRFPKEIGFLQKNMPINESSQVVRAVKKVLPAVVSITVSKKMPVLMPQPNAAGGLNFLPSGKKKNMKMGGGSGFIANSNGVILTNRHVIEDVKAEYLVVLQTGEQLKPEVLARDSLHDVAILKIEPPKGKKLPVVKFADSSKLELGQTVIAIGNALGLFKNTVSTGVVSGLFREIQAQSDVSQDTTRLRGLIQTDAAINPGNSGGPLVDLTGRAIGINAAMVFGAENIGFALPINNAKKALDELKQYGRVRQPFFGFRYLAINKQLQQDLRLPVNSGALVMAEASMPHNIKQAVLPGSPAHRAGLKEADIILEVNDKKISPEVSVNDILENCQIGQILPVKILRNGKEKTLKITLGEKW